MNGSINLDANEKVVMEGLNEFSYRLMTEYAAASDDGSFNVSPVSVSMFLSMMGNATAGEAHSQILAVLGSSDQTALNSLGAKLMHYLPCEDNGSCLEIGNRIWVADRYIVPQGLQSVVKESFNADVESVDFSVPSTVPAINGWVHDKTHGLIPGLLYGDWEHYNTLSMTSANTVYFKGEWKNKFDKSATKSGAFISPGGAVNVEMMHNVLEVPYAEADGVRMVQLFYKSSQNVIELYLPKADAEAKDIVASISPSVQKDLASKLKKYEVTITLPKFKTSPEAKNLVGVLENMGMASLEAVDCSPLGIGHTLPLDIAQQTYICVDEEGTELAAVTGWYESALPPEDQKAVSIDFDRPFMYIVRNCQTDAILMAGVVTNPQQ